MKLLIALLFACTVLAGMQCDIQKPVVCGFKGMTNKNCIISFRYLGADVS